MAVPEDLSYNEKRLLLALDAAGGRASPKSLVSSGEFGEEVEVMRAAMSLESRGMAATEGDSVKTYAAAADAELPERAALAHIHRAGGTLSMAALAEAMPGGMDKIAVGWLRKKGLADMARDEGGAVLALSDAGRAALASPMPDEAVLERMRKSPVPEQEIDPKILKDLKGRQGLVREAVESRKAISLTQAGADAARSGLSLKRQVSDITDRLIQSGEWREAELRRYDVNVPAQAIYPAKKHPLSRLGAEVRRMFTDMGFTEMSSEYVQPAFWNLDALYTPQDHPARDLQDTFYLSEPSSIRVEDEALVARVKGIHEDGGGTGSTGWGGAWSRERAEAALLRTHSTVSSIRYIAEHPDAPQKAFSISRIFRNESIDATHLPEFTQIEGIVIDENGSFDMLVSIIREFYSRMGFDQIRIRPAYFPYTEPSLELEVFFNGRWMELGGAGIFRPEVVAPFGVRHPVLAWGFGFERLAMLKWGIKDIRNLYISDIDALKASRSV